MVIPIAERHNEYAQKVASELKSMNVRVQVDDTSDRMNQRIRQAQLEKIPYMLVVGDKEMESSQVAPRLRTGEQLPPLSIGEFKLRILDIIQNKALDL
jgi:threonyl-tRNA synthetase